MFTFDSSSVPSVAPSAGPLRRLARRHAALAPAFALVLVAPLVIPQATSGAHDTARAATASVVTHTVPRATAHKGATTKHPRRGDASGRPASKGGATTRKSRSATRTAQPARRVLSGAVVHSAPRSAPRVHTSGIAPSTYVGSYYRPQYEAFRRCVVHRESRGNYAARNPRSTASGAYQFLLSTSNAVARMMDRSDLVGRPAGTWSRADQDKAFYVLFDHGRGIGHWGGSCH